MKTLYRFLTPLILSCLIFLHIRSLDACAQVSQFPIAAVGFEGNQNIATKQLKQQFSLSVEGGRYTAETLKVDLQRVEKLYQDEGFLDAKIGPPDVRIQNSTGGDAAYIRIPIAEGPRYSAGKVSVKNVETLDSQTLLQMCPLQKGQPYRRTLIIQWQEKIEDAYHSLGHLRAACRAQESRNTNDRTVDCALTCTAGRTYSVGKITIVGDESINRSQFKRRLLLSEGGIYNHDNLILSIQLLNQMHLYEPITFADVEMMIDDAGSTVDLTFHLSLINGWPLGTPASRRNE
jgi:outer membrane protein insertion porin family